MIEVKNLTKYYGGNAAIENINFKVEDCQILGLLGLNGAGKSTTMNIITGYMASTGGEVFADGVNLSEKSEQAKANIGYLPEQPPLYQDMCVDEYLDFVFNLKKAHKKIDDKKRHIEEICHETGIDTVYKRMIKNLSKGYKQRVGLAQAIIGNPGIIILDEPTSGLDPSQIVEIRKLIKKLGQSKTVIVSSHILSEIQEICDKIAVLHGGKIIAFDTPENLSKLVFSPDKMYTRIKGTPEKVANAICSANASLKVKTGKEVEPGVFEYTIRGEKGTDIRTEVFDIMAAAHLPMMAIKGSDFSLEDIFLKLISDETEDSEV